MVKSARIVLLSMFLGIVITLSGCGETIPAVVTPTPRNAPSPQSTSVIIPTITGVWTAYENRTMGIAFSYPADWDITEMNTGVRLNSPDGHHSVVIADNGLAGNDNLLTAHTRTINKLENIHPGTQVLQENDTVVAGQAARLSTVIYSYPAGSSGEVAEDVITTLAGSRVYIIELGSTRTDFPGVSISVFTPLLQHLRFTNPG